MVAAEMAQRGFRRLEVAAAWEEVLRRGYARRVHGLAAAIQDDWALAAQLAYRRQPEGPAQDVRPAPLAHVLEVGQGRHAYEAAAERLAWPTGPGPPKSGCPLLVAATLDPEGWRERVAEALQVARHEGARYLVLDARPDDLEALLASLGKGGWGAATEVRSFSELGDALAQSRAWVLAEPRRRALEPDWLTRGGACRSWEPQWYPTSGMRAACRLMPGSPTAWSTWTPVPGLCGSARKRRS